MGTQRDSSANPSEIFRAWARGLTEETLAATYGLDVSEVKRIIRAEKDKRPKITNIDPVEFFQDHTLRTEAAIEEFAMLAAREKGLVRVRAVEGRFIATKHLFEIHQAAGVLPRDLAELGVHIRLTEATERINSVLHDHDFPLEVLDEVVVALIGPGQSSEE